MKKNIILIEDSSFVRSLLKHALLDKGFEVYEVEKGIQILRSKKFNPAASEGVLDKVKADLFIIDIELEDMSGIEVLKRLKAHPDFKSVPAIVNSSHDDKESIITAITSGADDYVLKKDNFVNILVDKVEKVFEKELNTFESTLEKELDWVRYGGRELSFALLSLKYKSGFDETAKKEFLSKAIEKLKGRMRHYDWIFFLKDNTIAVILLLTTVQDVVILRNRLLELLNKLAEELHALVDIQIGFSHYPTNAKTAEELIATAKGQIK